jgi:hypothetical protein
MKPSTRLALALDKVDKLIAIQIPEPAASPLVDVGWESLGIKAFRLLAQRLSAAQDYLARPTVELS